MTSDEKIRDWIGKLEGPKLYSTDSAIINFDGILYNVSGSTEDPPEVVACPGCSWKELLVKSADLAKARCYVGNSDAPEKSSHNNFSVGGHMTPNKDGHVDVGADSFLMPLCSWHNSTARNGVPFQVSNRRLLRLKGYMLGESFVTFAARSPARSERKYGLIYLDGDDLIWKTKDVNPKQATKLKQGSNDSPESFVLIEKSSNEDGECIVQEIQMS